MTPAPLAFPNSQVLAHWWRDIAGRPCHALGVGYVLVHHVEVLALVSRTRAIDPLSRFLLKASIPEEIPSPTATQGPGPSSEHDPAPAAKRRIGWSLDHADTLGLERPLLRQLLLALERDGLVTPSTPRGSADAVWIATAAGEQAHDHGSQRSVTRERRILHFVESLDRPGQIQFVKASFPQAGRTIVADDPAMEPRPFNVEVLLECARAPTPWKNRRGFPQDIESIVDPRDGQSPSESDSWQRIIVDRQERWFLLLVREAGRLCGYCVTSPGWTLHAEAPCFELTDGDWEDLFPGMATNPRPDEWGQAWMAWGQSRHLSPTEIPDCALEHRGIHLCVRAGKRLMDRLRGSRNEILKGQSWILTGQGALRSCALLDIVESA